MRPYHKAHHHSGFKENLNDKTAVFGYFDKPPVYYILIASKVIFKYQTDFVQISPEINS